MSKTPLTPSELSQDESRDLIAMFDNARTPDQVNAAVRIAKMCERGRRTSATKANKRTRGFVGMVAAIQGQLRTQ